MADGECALSVSQSAQFKTLRARLKGAEKEIRLKFLAAVRAATAPLKDDVRQSALELLPRRGGLAAKIADSKFATRTGAASVMFQTVNQYSIRAIDRGRIRHPVFQRDGMTQTPWVNQPVSEGFWTKPTEKRLPEIRAAVDEAMDEAAREIENG